MCINRSYLDTSQLKLVNYQLAGGSKQALISWHNEITFFSKQTRRKLCLGLGEMILLLKPKAP